MSVQDLIDQKLCDGVVDEKLEPLAFTAQIHLPPKLKLIVKNSKAVLLTTDLNGNYHAYDIEKLRDF